MRPVEIGLVDATGTVGAKVLAEVVAALNVQVTHHLPRHWSTAPAAVVRLLADPHEIPLGVWPIQLVKELKLKEGGFHSTAHNQPFAKVVVSATTDDWTIAASHEAMEMLIDPSGNRLQVATAIHCREDEIKDAKGDCEYLLEICDPCESKDFSYRIGGIAVSDFVTPAFYDDAPLPGEQYSFTGRVLAPRRILPGGYITWVHGRNQEIRQMIWLDPKGQPKTRVVGQVNGGNLRSHVDSETQHLVKAAQHFPFKFQIEPGGETKRFKLEHEHWVTYHQNGDIEIDSTDHDGADTGTHRQSVRAHHPIRRSVGAYHTVRNNGGSLLTGDKDLIDPATLVP